MALSEALLIHERDTVATALRDLGAGERITVKGFGKVYELEVLEPIPVFHKIALVETLEGEMVYKYGEVIGKATSRIMSGAYAHIHNIMTLRG
jgi:altronate dehydratase small subunit